MLQNDTNAHAKTLNSTQNTTGCTVMEHVYSPWPLEFSCASGLIYIICWHLLMRYVCIESPLDTCIYQVRTRGQQLLSITYSTAESIPSFKKDVYTHFCYSHSRGPPQYIYSTQFYHKPQDMQLQINSSCFLSHSHHTGDKILESIIILIVCPNCV